jgi:outer membrane protein OmpA-like peptidoglycan-associated protein
VVGQTDKLGDKNYNAKLAQARSQAVASELIHAGYPAQKVVIASNPEAFGNMSFGGEDASTKDRRVTILFR